MHRREFFRKATSGSAAILLPSLLPSLILNSLRREKRDRYPTLEYIERTFYSMGTLVSFSVYGESKELAHQAITKAFHSMQYIEEKMSVYKPSSDVSNLNRNAGKEMVSLHHSVIEILKAAKRYHRLTKGAFDITVEPLMKLWGFRSEKLKGDRLPTDREIALMLDAVGMNHLVIDSSSCSAAFTQSNSQLDLGGIAVGYAIDAAVEILRKEGVYSALINHSGDIYALAAPPDSDGWAIAIPHPTNENEIVRSYSVRDMAISTSSNSKQFVECNRMRYGHILHPRLGKPANEMLSATILASRAIDADAFSTGIFTMGIQNAANIITQDQSIRMILVDRGGNCIELGSGL